MQDNTPKLLPLGLAALALGCLALAPTLLRAGDNGGPLSVGGGDAIGSLPFVPTPPEGLVAPGMPTAPSIVLEGPSLAAINELVVDAWGDGWAELAHTQAGVRVELQGRVQLLVDRNRLGESEVTVALDVSQGFSGGLGVLTLNSQVVSHQFLPQFGDLVLPLGMLSESGFLDEGVLTLHSFSTTRKHHGLDMTGSGGLLRLSSHE